MSINLTTTSYVVLGLVARLGACTPYDLKRAVYHTIEYFWAFPHSQLYAEPERLKQAGLLREKREPDGRRRRLFSLTEAGRQALAAWLQQPVDEPTEIRDLGMLKLYFGELGDAGDVAALARGQQQLHRQRLATLEALLAERRSQKSPDYHRYRLAILEMGILFEKAADAFWSSIAEPADLLLASNQSIADDRPAGRAVKPRAKRGRQKAAPSVEEAPAARETQSEIDETLPEPAESTQLPEHLL